VAAPPLALRRSQYQTGAPVTETRTRVQLDPDALATLEEQQRFLRRSLSDLEREHDAGDLDDDDYATLKHDYEARLTAVSRAVDEGQAEFASHRRTSNRGRTAAVIAGVVVFALVCGVLVAHSAGRREAGNTITGDISETARERNTQCLNEARDDTSKAIACYTSVLADAPQNVEALTYRGWMRFVNGDAQGILDLQQAVKLDGTYPDVHAFLAIVLFRAGCATDAQAELHRLDALNPSPLITDQVASLRAQVQQALANPASAAPCAPSSSASTSPPASIGG
jgi:cytochrome c-type biogenesis protein CcmH/NrfG